MHIFSFERAFRGISLWLPGILLAVASTYGQSRDSMDVQNARTNYVKATGLKKTYNRQWDLSGLPAYSPGPKVSGTIRIWGLNYIADDGLNKVWEDGFHHYHPDVKFEYNLPTALIAIPGLVSGQADLGASRPITFDETLLFERIFGRSPLEITMLTGSYDVSGWSNAIAFVVHKDNPISKLTLDQLDGIFGAQRDGGHEGTAWNTAFARGADKNIRKWGQLGLSGDWADKTINLYAVHLRFHHPRHIEKVIFKGGTKWNETLHEYSNAANPDGTLALTSKRIIGDLSKDRYGIAITGVKDINEHTKVLALAKKAGDPYVELTIENVQNRTYPMTGSEYWYLDRDPNKPLDPKLKEYLKYTLSREGQEAVSREGKFLPLTAEVAREQLKKLE